MNRNQWFATACIFFIFMAVMIYFAVHWERTCMIVSGDPFILAVAETTKYSFLVEVYGIGGFISSICGFLEEK